MTSDSSDNSAPPPPESSAEPGPEEEGATRTSYPVGQPGQPVYHTSGVYGAQHARPPQRGSRRTLITAVIAGGLAVVVAAVLLVVLVFKPGSSAPPAYGMIPTGSSPSEDAGQVAAAFLAAWQSGDLTKAANYTDQPAAAKTALAAYAKDLDLGKFGLKAGAATAAKGSTADAPRQNVAFAVSASVGATSGKSAVRGTWPYHSTLVAYQKPKSAVWFVQWQPDVVAPNVTAATHLTAVQVPPTVSTVTDASGKNLASLQATPAWTRSPDSSRRRPRPARARVPGLDVEIATKAGTPVTGSQAVIIAPGSYPTLSTTLNSKDEAAARAAVGLHKQSAMVAIQPSTGHILAIANNAGFNDFALTADVAPGSTMKTITSTALFNAGLVTPGSGVACPASYTVQGITYHNDQGESEPAGTPFSYDFAQSCNNAFTQWWPHLSGKLASTAQDYYGLNQKWDIGLGASASYFNAPASASGSELAQEAFGEGSLIASPLAMASVAATIDTGHFQQPVLTLSAKQSVTAKALPPSTDADLKQMMRDVVTQGTAAGLGFGPTVYAKTGTADIQGQDQPNSWLIAFDPTKDIAVADLVVNAGYGAQFAGPEVSSFLKAIG